MTLTVVSEFLLMHSRAHLLFSSQDKIIKITFSHMTSMEFHYSCNKQPNRRPLFCPTISVKNCVCFVRLMWWHSPFLMLALRKSLLDFYIFAEQTSINDDFLKARSIQVLRQQDRAKMYLFSSMIS